MCENAPEARFVFSVVLIPALLGQIHIKVNAFRHHTAANDLLCFLRAGGVYCPTLHFSLSRRVDDKNVNRPQTTPTEANSTAHWPTVGLLFNL
jgi:hypothetical protein